jgi:hypothetical protein
MEPADEVKVSEEPIINAPVEETEETEEVVVSIGEEQPQEEHTPAPEWVKELRKTNRELQRQNRELQNRLQVPPTENKPVVGAKPKLEDHDYDADKYEEALADWFEQKRQADEATAKAETEVMNQQREWQAKLDGYSKSKAQLRVKDFEDAEAIVQSALNLTQQGIIIDALDNPAMMVVALGKNPEELKKLAAITSPTKFLRELSRIEDTKLKVTSRKQAPPPEPVVTGTARSSGAVDSTLERLREEAAKTGNMSKVFAYKQQKRA